MDDSHCREHPDNVLTMFCCDCQVIICRECKIDHHIHHKSEDVEKTAEKVKTELSNIKIRFQNIHDNLVTIVKKRKQDLDEYEQKKDVVQREILQRYNKIKALAKANRDDALAALQSCDNEVGHKLEKELDDVNQNLKEAHYLFQRIEEAESKGKSCTIITVYKEMTSGIGSEAAVRRLTTIGRLDQACRPVHRSALPDDDAMFQTMKIFIGKCEVVTLPRVEEQEPGLVGKEEFQCGDHDDVTVFSLKAETNNDFNVSFDPFYHNQLPPAKCYQQQKSKFTILKNTSDKEQLGRKSFALLDGRLSFRNTLYLSVYCKSCWNNATFVLSNKSNLCALEMTKFVSSKVSDKELFTIQSKACRAMDVDSSQKYFVVVEEGEKPDRQRKVLLYRRPDNNSTVTAVDTYTSPITPFQPADVLFYTLMGQTDKKVLIIADEANDALHVAEVKDDRVTFTHFLCPGCPLLLQPTALNTDHENRLWVGCRGGRILIFHREVEDYNNVNALCTVFKTDLRC